MADIQQYSVSIKFKTEGSEATEEKVKKLQGQVDKLKSSGKGFDLSSIINVSKLGTVASKVGGVLKTVVTSIFSERTGRAIGNATKSMADYIETVNLFRTSLGAAGDEAMKFVNRAEGELGLDPEQLMHSISSFYNLADGLGIANDRAYLMAQNLTQLTGDLSSFANISQKAAEQKLMSGFSGQVKPLREYGIALDQASLQELAYSLGIDQRVKSMTRAQKTELIYYQIMKSTQKMQGDLSRTLLSPANSLRVMQTEFKQLARAIGSIFIPGMMRIIPVVRMITKALTEAAKSIANFFGFEITDYYADLSDVGTLLDGVGDDIDGVGDSAEGTAKKLNKMLMPFDELNNITSGSGSGSGSGAGEVGFGGSLGIDLPTYDMFQGEGLGALINNGKLLEDIRKFGEKLNKAMSNIPWSDIQKDVKTAAENIAEALNVGITSIDWNLLGQTLAGGANTALTFLSNFVTTFDFKNLGKSLSDGVNGFFNNIDWSKAGETFSGGLTGILDTVITYLDNLDTSKLEESLWNFLANIDWVKLLYQVGRLILKGLRYSPIIQIPEIILNLVEKALNSLLKSLGVEDFEFNISAGWSDRVDEVFDGLEKGLDNGYERISGKNKELKKEIEDSSKMSGGESAYIDSNNVLAKMHSDMTSNFSKMNVSAKAGSTAIGNSFHKGLADKKPSILSVFEEYKEYAKKNLNQDKNAKTYGANTIAGYGEGIDSKKQPILNGFIDIKEKFKQNLNLGNESNSWGSSTIQEYQKGIEMQNDPISRALGKVNSLISDNLDESDNSSAWGSSTVEEYVKGIDSQNNPVTRALGTINSLLKGNLDQSNNSSNWGSSTVNEYNKGIENKGSGTRTSVNQITGIVGGLNQSSNSSGWGSSTMAQYNQGLGSQNDPISRTIGTVKSILSGNLSSTSSYSWGKDLIQGLINGMKAKKKELEDSSFWVSNMIASYIHFSRPDKGPLREYEKWMPDMVIGLTNSLLQAMPKLNNIMMKVSTDLKESFTQAGLPKMDNPFADGSINPSVVGEIVNRTSASNKDSSMSNMATATYSAISRALSENKANDSQKIIVNVGNKTVYEGYGTYRDEQSKMLGVNT